MFTKIINFTVALIFTSSNSFAQGVPTGFFGNRGGSEFWVGKEQGKPLITVNLLSGVNSPGIYHIPVDTNLAQLIAYAGGTERNSEISEVTIRRTKGKDELEILQYNFERISKGNGPIPTFNDKDVVIIPVSWSLERTAQYIAIISGITAILLSINTLHRTNW